MPILRFSRKGFVCLVIVFAISCIWPLEAAADDEPASDVGFAPQSDAFGADLFPASPVGAPKSGHDDIHASKPLLRLPLYANFIALQALDVASTRRALGSGGREVNPLLLAGGLTSSPAIVVVKGIGAGAIACLTEKLWARHPRVAAVMMVALNAGYVAIVTHNYSIASRTR